MEFHLGQILKELRRSRELTLDQLSRNSGVSKSMLSQIESGKTNPTLAMLLKISQGLQIPIQTLIAQVESPDSTHSLTVHPRNQSAQRKNDPELKMFKRSFQQPKLLDVDIPGVHFSVLTPLDMAQKLEVYQIIFSPMAVLFSKGHGNNVLELITVLEGSFQIETPEGTMSLDPGDFACYPASDIHVIKNRENSPGKVQLIVQFP